MTGFLLVAPVMTTGLCELSRLRARGSAPDLDASLDILVRGGTDLFRYGMVLAIAAALIVGLTAIGFATLLVGMIVAIPLLGHATWHAHRDLIP